MAAVSAASAAGPIPEVVTRAAVENAARIGPEITTAFPADWRKLFCAYTRHPPRRRRPAGPLRLRRRIVPVRHPADRPRARRPGAARRDARGSVRARARPPGALRLPDPFHLPRGDGLSLVPVFRILSECSGSQCTVINSITGQSQAVRISDVELTTDGTETLGTKHGVTLGATSTVYMGQEVTTFGAWMAHSEFRSRRPTRPSAASSPAPHRPTGSATWRAVMVGRPATGKRRVGYLAIRSRQSDGRECPPGDNQVAVRQLCK